MKTWGLSVSDWRGKLNANHIFTHIEWRMTGYLLTVTGADNQNFQWLDASELQTYAAPSAFARFRAAASEALKTASDETEART